MVGMRHPALRLPGAPVVASDSLNDHETTKSAALADNHLASPTMTNHYSDHLLSAYSESYAVAGARGK
jgi:hypothetical protein